MHDRPEPAQLLAMVRRLMRETVIPKLDPSTAYQVRVASNVIEIVARQIERGADDAAAELASLNRLLGTGGDDLRALNRELAERLQDGRLAYADPAVRDHLWQVTLAKLAVDQPSYPRYVEVTTPEH